MTNEIDRNETGLVAAVSQQLCPDIDPKEFLRTLTKLVCNSVKGGLSNEELMAYLMTCREHELNPLMKEIYPFRDRRGGFQVVVGVDGWTKIMNRHPQFDGMDVSDNPDAGSCTVSIHRKDREHPTVVTEWLAECKMDSHAWDTRPIRMLRHKATIQCIRYAFGLSGMMDPEEANEINGHTTTVTPVDPAKTIPSSYAIEKWARDHGVTINEIADAAESKYGKGWKTLTTAEWTDVKDVLVTAKIEIDEADVYGQDEGVTA